MERHEDAVGACTHGGFLNRQDWKLRQVRCIVAVAADAWHNPPQTGLHHVRIGSSIEALRLRPKTRAVYAKERSDRHMRDWGKSTDSTRVGTDSRWSKLDARSDPAFTVA